MGQHLEDLDHEGRELADQEVDGHVVVLTDDVGSPDDALPDEDDAGHRLGPGIATHSESRHDLEGHQEHQQREENDAEPAEEYV